MASRLVTKSTSSRVLSIRSFSRTACIQRGSSPLPKPPLPSTNQTPEDPVSIPGYEPTYEPPALDSNVPRATLRALFALHHSASSFITPENIDQKINEEFAASNAGRMNGGHGRTMINLDELKRELSETTQRPALTEDVQGSMRTTMGNDPMRNQTHWRDAEVKAALWGSSGTKPGLEIVEDYLAESQKEKERGKH
ncbi:hypothetical protein FRC03_009798 [Tulasnella sp. 419]|nr:hypothetical protein FRC03_009798 [Tulasnella sp. 419]